MSILKRKPKVLTPEQAEEVYTKDFFDMILPGVIKFLSDHYIVGDSYRSVWVIKEYPHSEKKYMRVRERLIEIVKNRSL